MVYDKKVSAAMRERRRLDFNLQVKSLDAKGRFAGYASVFDVVDSQKDIILRGAFARSLKGRVQDIKMLWQHQQNEPIGVFERMFEDARGLYVEGRLLLDVARAREAYALLQEGALGGLSIGYSPIKYRINEKSGVRMLSEVELWEISLVTFPANEAAKITVVKGEFSSCHPLPSPPPQAGEGIRRSPHRKGEGGACAPTQLVDLMQAIDRARAVLF